MTRAAWSTQSLALAALVAGTLLTGPGEPLEAAQQPAPAQPTLSLSSDLQGAGSTAVISLTLRAPEGVAVARTVSDIEFPTKFLAFHNATRGLSTEAVGGQITVTPKPPVGDQSVVQIVVTAKEGEALPAGSLAELRFRIQKEAKVDAKLVLKNTASAFSDTAGTTPIASLVAQNGEVKVTKTALLPACFFYMH